MPCIRLVNVTKQFSKGARAVDGLNLTIEDGDFVSLLGPSGCGKTTTLRMIAGLEMPTEGDIYFDDKCVFSAEKGINVSPDKRGVGFLFQNYALWPHMTVRQNIAFGLENMKWEKTKIESRVREICGIMRIAEYVDRYPAELSGGQQQRVAIARTLAPNPRALLMDEPLSNLDAKLRNDMRAELKRLHMTTGATFVYVTHDQSEAMTLSSKICLMKTGVLQQYCPPLELYGEPCNMFCADFMGNPAMNFVECTGTPQADGGIELKAASFDVVFHPAEGDLKGAGRITAFEGGRCVLGIRPEMVKIVDEGGIEGKVISSLPTGMDTVLALDTRGITLSAVAFGRIDYTMDSMVRFQFEGDYAVLFDKDSTERFALGSLEIL
ncbi:MAG: ABC transporter ATP-binding protein [Fretibacterium sp.]|nr:ABC transporter ATP-binding protein [Fretibacterium sp.]